MTAHLGSIDTEDERMRTRLGAAAIVAALIIPSGGAAVAQSPGPDVAHAAVADADGTDVGSVTWTQGAGTVTVEVAAHGLAPGFHGFHVHAVGECVAPFTSAGSHLDTGGASHPAHAADQPVLLVNADGTGPPCSTRIGTPWRTSSVLR